MYGKCWTQCLAHNKLLLFFKISVYLFIRLGWILVATYRLSCSMRDLVPWPGMEPQPPALVIRNLNHNNNFWEPQTWEPAPHLPKLGPAGPQWIGPSPWRVYILLAEADIFKVLYSYSSYLYGSKNSCSTWSQRVVDLETFQGTIWSESSSSRSFLGKGGQSLGER